MSDVNSFKFLFTAGIAALTGGGVGVAIIIVLSKKIVDQLLKKDIEKFKTELSLKLKYDQDISRFNFNEEVKVIKAIWIDIQSLIDICAKFRDGKDDKILNDKNKALKDNYAKNIPFIHKELGSAIEKLIEISNIEEYSEEKFQHIEKVANNIVSIIRLRFQLI